MYLNMKNESRVESNLEQNIFAISHSCIHTIYICGKMIYNIIYDVRVGKQQDEVINVASPKRCENLNLVTIFSAPFTFSPVHVESFE